MQFINIVVHSVEDMNFRVHLQFEFTHHGLDAYLEVGHLPPVGAMGFNPMGCPQSGHIFYLSFII